LYHFIQFFVAAATAVALLQYCHRHCCHHCRATTVATKLPPLRRRQAANVAPTAVTLLQCCHHRCCHCCHANAAAVKLLPPSCPCQAATAATAKLPLPPSRCQAAAAVATAVTHAEIKYYTYIGIHNEYTLASTVIGTLGITIPNVVEKK
jgi:hypothetical protein